MIALWPYPNSTSFTMVGEIVELNFAITLLEGWLQLDWTVG